MESFSLIIPVRSGSKRVVRKNTKPFLLDGRSLLEHKLSQVSRISKHFSQVVVSTDDEEVIDQLGRISDIENLVLDRRPKELCRSDTKVVDLINYVAGLIKTEHIFWLHVTSPFMSAAHYLDALDIYKREVVGGGAYDSLMSVNKLQQFIWSDASRAVINCDRAVNKWPNTQDLEPLFEINHAFYISSRENYLKLEDRIGLRPYLYECNGLQKVDIDWPDDFELAQQLLPAYLRSEYSQDDVC